MRGKRGGVAVELGAPVSLRRVGWTRALAVGMNVNVAGNRSRAEAQTDFVACA